MFKLSERSSACKHASIKMEGTLLTYDEGNLGVSL